MKRFFLLITFFLAIAAQSQDKVSVNKQEITIPIGKKITLKAEIKENKIINFKTVDEQNITEKIDLLEALKSFEKDDIKDNSIEFVFSETQMMNSSLIALKTIQKTGKRMTFKAKIRLKGTSSYQPTSIIPIVSNATSIEEWRDDIDSILLYDFQLEK